MVEKQNNSLLRSIETWLDRFIGGFIGLLLGLMVIIVFSNVIARYFLNFSLAWSEEISRFMLIWLAFLGSYLAFVKNEHLGLDLIVFLPPKTQAIIRTIAALLVIVALAILLYGGWSVTSFTIQSGWTSPALSIPYGIVYAVVPFCAALLFFQSIVKFGGQLRSLVKILRGED